MGCSQCGTSTGTHWPGCSHYIGPPVAPEVRLWQIERAAGHALVSADRGQVAGPMAWAPVDVRTSEYDAKTTAAKLGEETGVHHRVRKLDMSSIVSALRKSYEGQA